LSAAVDFNLRRLTLAAMTLAHFPELKRLPSSMRLRLAEELWDSAASDDLPVPASHKAIIRTRREAYRRGEMATLTMAQLKKAIRRRA
jgi:putative addiction module component (TIGR02574 family)